MTSRVSATPPPTRQVAGFRPPGDTGSLSPPPGAAIIKDEDRTLIWLQTLPDGDRVVVKMYRHRNRIDFWRERLHRFRVQREFDALARMARYEVPCSEPVFWTYGRSPDNGRYEILVTREIADATPVRELILSGRDHTRDLDLRPLFQVVRRMHASGVYHGALNTRNVLLAGGRYYIIDPPRSLLHGGSIEGQFAAWADMLYLCHNLCHFSKRPPDTLPIEAYGWDAQARKKFLDALAGYRREKGQRWRVRIRIMLSYARSRLTRT